jgi:ribosomal protein L37AE/L43A
MAFQPAFCPCENPECDPTPGFQYQRRGTFRRLCDGRVVQRYYCKRCKRTFSSRASASIVACTDHRSTTSSSSAWFRRSHSAR